MSMTFGANIFLTDQTISPIELAQELESRGFESLWLPEHTHIPVSRRTPAPMGEPIAEEYKRCLDPLVALAMAGAVTDRLRLGTGVMLLAEREPLAIAKATATLDSCLGGRLRLGIGYGWNIEELEDHGGTKQSRRAVVRERALAMQELWAEEEATFAGEHVNFAPCWSWPKPVQQSLGRVGVPLYLGGEMGPKFLDHLVEYASGWLPHGGAGVAAALPRITEALAEAGRDPDVFVVIPFGTKPTEAKVEHFASAGISEMVVQLPSASRDEVLGVLDELAPLVSRFSAR